MSIVILISASALLRQVTPLQASFLFQIGYRPVNRAPGRNIRSLLVLQALHDLINRKSLIRV